MKILDIAHYDHFVSFFVDADDGSRVHAQYRAEQVWQDDNGTWQMADDAEPFHVTRSSASGGGRADVSTALRAALRNTAALS